MPILVGYEYTGVFYVYGKERIFMSSSCDVMLKYMQVAVVEWFARPPEV